MGFILVLGFNLIKWELIIVWVLFLSLKFKFDFF